MNNEVKSTIKYIVAWLGSILFLVATSRGAFETQTSLPEPMTVLAITTTESLPMPTVVPAASALPNVPLSTELVKAVVIACDKYSVPVELAFAVMEVESGYTLDAVNGACIGLYQINTEYLAAYEDALGITDIHEPAQNIECGVWYLGELLRKHGEVNLALMHYNLGTKADKLWREGVHETEYTIKVNAAFVRLKGEV